jgi:uncharacterized LabA/DUF88 family protein
MIFIDGMNFLRAWKTICSERGLAKSTRFDAIKLRQILASLWIGRDLVKIRYYSSTIPSKDSEHLNLLRGIDPRGFHGFLKRNGYDCVIRENRVRYEDCPLCNQRYPVVAEKGVDVAIALDMMVSGIENRFDVVLLVSGDADFIPVVEALDKKGKTVEVAQFSNVISWHLRKSVRRVHELDSHFDTLILEK